jgi:hypothetical protein
MSTTPDWQSVTPDIFAGLFPREGKTLFPSTLEMLSKADTRFRPASSAEYDEYLLHYLSLLKRNEIVRDTEQNHQAWLRGWTESMNEIIASGPSAIACRPKYFRGSKFFRWRKGLVTTPNPQLEYDLFVAARHQIFRYWLSDAPSIHELGCGSGGNLWLLQEIFPDKKIRGYDWVEPSVKIAEGIGKSTGHDVGGSILNFLEPPARVPLDTGAAVITIHALEQIGNRFGPLLDSILAARPSIVVHYEPVIEYYDSANVLDYLAIWYSEKRSYLNGLPGALHALQKAGRIEILEEHRPQLGGTLHEASLIVWRPL